MGNTSAYLRPADFEAYQLISSQAIAGVRYPYGTHTRDGRFAGYQIVRGRFLAAAQVRTGVVYHQAMRLSGLQLDLRAGGASLRSVCRITASTFVATSFKVAARRLI